MLGCRKNLWILIRAKVAASYPTLYCKRTFSASILFIVSEVTIGNEEVKPTFAPHMNVFSLN